MRLIARSTGLLGLFMLVAVLVAGPAWSAGTVSFQVTQQGTAIANTPVVLFTSYGRVEGRTNQQGQVSFDFGKGKGFWVEVNGARLNRFFEVATVPAVLDVNQIGTMTWKGGK
jgi:hypothetical protein